MESEVIIVQKMSKCFEGYAKQYVEKEKISRELQDMVSHPSKRKYKGMVVSELLLKSPITKKEITNAKSIFGLDLAGLRGKTLRKKTIMVDTEEYDQSYKGNDMKMVPCTYILGTLYGLHQHKLMKLSRYLVSLWCRSIY